MNTYAEPSSPMSQALEAARSLVGALATVASELPVATVDTLFERSVTISTTGEGVLQLIEVIREAAKQGHSCRAEMDDDGELDVVWRTDADAEVSGSSDFLVDPVDQTNLARLIAASDVDGIFTLLRDRKFIIRTSLRYQEPGSAWIPSCDLLVESLCSPSWLSTAMQLSQCRIKGRAVLYVEGLSKGLSTRALVFVPAESVRPVDASLGLNSPGGTGEAFCENRIQQGWPRVPAPDDVLPATDAEGRLAEALRSVAHVLTWMWLSCDPPAVTATSVTCRYRGVRDVEMSLSAPASVDPKSLEQALALWRWTAAVGDDPVRMDAVQRAITLAAAEPSDLLSAAGPALRTARTLHDLATSGAVAEAMAARRAGREAAVGAANSAAAMAREAAGKATERSLALMVAAAAVVFATVQKVLEWYVSALALALLAALLCGGLLVARRVDLAAAEGVLTAFEEDVDTFREAISADDLQQIKQSAALRNSRRHVGNARSAATLVYSGSISIAVLLASGLAVANLW